MNTKRVLFIDRTAAIEDEKVKALEALGYLVIPVAGTPNHVVHETFVSQQ